MPFKSILKKNTALREEKHTDIDTKHILDKKRTVTKGCTVEVERARRRVTTNRTTNSPRATQSNETDQLVQVLYYITSGTVICVIRITIILRVMCLHVVVAGGHYTYRYSFVKEGSSCTAVLKM